MKRIIRKLDVNKSTSGERQARRRAPTLSDVATFAGCAISVVSTVVNGAKGNVVVSQATRQRVMDAAVEMGYKVNFASQSLVTRRTRSLGLYFPDAEWTGPGFSYDDAILRGVQAGCTANGYDLVLVTAPGGRRLEKCREYLMAGRIDGIVLAHVGRSGKWVEELLQMHLPVVAVDFSKPPADLDAMVFDNEAAVQCALDHLWSLGHKRIGFIGSELATQPLDAELRSGLHQGHGPCGNAAQGGVAHWRGGGQGGGRASRFSLPNLRRSGRAADCESKNRRPDRVDRLERSGWHAHACRPRARGRERAGGDEHHGDR